MSDQPKEAYYQAKLQKLADAQERIFERPLLPKSPQTFHIVGICGTAMGALAGLLNEKGYNVTGSDQACYPPISTMLESLHVETHFGNYEAGNIGDADVVVIGNVVRPQNPEARHARENNLPQAVLPEVLREYVFDDAKRIVVAGTHGKTTTTGMVTALFKAAGADPGFIIGGIPQGEEKSFALGAGQYAIFEGDEYDTSYFNKMPKFLQYGAHTGIVTAIELDHLDIYDDLNDYAQAFTYFAEGIPSDGFLFVNGDHATTRQLTQCTTAKVKTYGLGIDNDIHPSDLRIEDGYQTFELVIDDKIIGTMQTPLSGSYNVANLIAAAAVAVTHGLPFEKLVEGARQFRGMKRRQEVVYNDKGIMVVDDFAHHPTSVKETLQGLKEKYAGRRLLAIFEPRSNSSRKKIFEAAYTTSFDAADMVFIKMPPFRDNDNPDDFIDITVMADTITESGIPTFAIPDVHELVQHLVAAAKEGDVLVMMSNGNFDGLQDKLLAALAEKE